MIEAAMLRHRQRDWLVLTSMLLGLAAMTPAGAADEAVRNCLPSLGADPATPPAVRLNGVMQMGTTGDAMGAIMSGARAPFSHYVPGTKDATEGPSRRLFDGIAEAQAGRHEAAHQQFTRCIEEAAQARDGILQAACRNNLGAVAAARGLYAEARSSFERAAQQYRAEIARMPSAATIRQRQAEATARAAPKADELSAAFKGSAPDDPDRVPSAAELKALLDRQMQIAAGAQRGAELTTAMRESLNLAQVTMGTELVALNLASVAYALGQWEEALGHLKQALAPYEGPLSCRPAALDELQRLRERLQKKDEVTALVERYQRAVKRGAEPAKGGLAEMGTLTLGGSTGRGTGTALAAGPAAPPAAQPMALRSSASARGRDEPAVQLFTDPLATTSETRLQELLARAAGEERAGQSAPARRSLGSLVLRAQAAGRSEIEATAQAALMRLEDAAGRPASAIFHGKRAANLLQTLRRGVADLPRNERRSYLREREQVYSRLAQLLMQKQRLVEAERVLQMLKEDEGQQFTAASARKGYASLPETTHETALRTRAEQAARALRGADEERTAVGADRTYGLLLTFDLVRIEKDRLRAATELQAFLNTGKGGAAEQEKALRGMPLEFQTAFMALFAERGQKLGALLRALQEDAPQFRATPATPQQLAAIAEVVRRADELRSAMAPVLEAMRRAPSPTMAQSLQRDLDPAQIAAKSREQAMNQLDAMMKGPLNPQDLAARVALAEQSNRQWGGMQTATGLAMQAYMAALMGQEDRASLAQVDGVLKGAPPEALDGFLVFVRQQGQQMQGAGRAAPQSPATMAGAAPEAALAALMGRLLNLGKRGERSAAPVANPTAAPPPAADNPLVASVQAQLEASTQRARAAAGPSLQETTSAQLAAIAGQQPQQRSSLDAPAMAMAEPLGRLWRIEQQRTALEARSLDTLAQAEEALESAPDTLPAGADESRPALAALAVPTVLLYYLPHDSGVEVLLVSAQGRQKWRVQVPRAELDREVEDFSLALRDVSIDPRPAAGALHKRLFAPVAAALQQTGAKVIALSLSGRLRFVPFAALHDGSGWLAQRHAFAVYPGGRLADVLKPASQRWQVAAFGASQGGASLPPLHGVPQELGLIVQQGPGGALPGRQWLDRAFTAQSLREALAGNNQVVHIASHFKFEPGDAAQSFLLLGDGGRLSLKDLGGPDYRFDRTELVTLSACQTGVSGDDAFGQEVDGLAALLMAQGAPSVLASLWQVADGSTAQLMGTMYGLHAQRAQHPLSRVQALQQAQLAMIGSASTAPEAAAVGLVAKAEGPDRLADAAGTFEQRGVGRPQDRKPKAGGAALGAAHPYHWAPFVLMGSWQ